MWSSLEFPAGSATFTEEILHGRRHFLYSEWFQGFIPNILSAMVFNGTTAFL